MPLADMLPSCLSFAAKIRGVLRLALISWSAVNAAESVPAKIMPLGDSITRGTNDINYPNGDIPGGYRRDLGLRLSAAGFSYDFVGANSDNAAPGMDPHHNGNNGFRTDQMLSILPGLLAVDPDVVLLMAGTNDVLQAVPTATAAGNLRNLIEQITGDDPDRRLYVATILPITQNWNGQSAAVLNANANLFNTELRNLVGGYAAQGRKVRLVDMNGLIVLNDGDPAKNFFQPGDGVHPGQAGYDQLGALWFEAITADGSLLDLPKQGLPARPRNLTVSVVSPGRINLAWSDMAENETAYQVFTRPLSGGVWQRAAVLPRNASSHFITGLVNGVESYGFAVAAVNANGASPWSEVRFSPSPGDRAHLRPASASSVYNNIPSYGADKANDGRQDTIWASATGTNQYLQVDLQGEHHLQNLKLVTRQDSDVADHRKNFEIRVSNDPAFSDYQVLTAQGATPLPFKATLTQNLSNLQGYRYVRVVKTDNKSFAFTLLQAYGTEETSVPETPGELAVAGAGDRWVRLNWQVMSDNESGFILERATGASGGFAQIATLPAGSLRFLDETVNPGIEYRYRLSATNESGVSSVSNEVSATTATIGSYQAWREAHPEFATLDGSETHPMADANGDGTPNLLAYAAGFDPMQALVPSSLAGLETRENGEWFFRYRRNRNAVELEYELVSNGDLAGNIWSLVDQSAATVSEVAGEPGVEEVSVPILPAAGQSRMFFKLKVVNP